MLSLLFFTIHSDKLNLAAARIQAHWRGYSIRRDIAQHTTYWLSAVTMQSAWRRYVARRHASGLGDGKSGATPRVWGKLEKVAATKIQVSFVLLKWLQIWF